MANYFSMEERAKRQAEAAKQPSTWSKLKAMIPSFDDDEENPKKKPGESDEDFAARISKSFKKVK